jgi:aryl-alcohol dehydrogenase-like predicted oxidoreductase
VIRPTDPEEVFSPGGSIETLLELKKSGKVRYIGFTGHKSPDIHLHMLRTAGEHGVTFDTVQMPLNAVDPHFRSFEKNVLPVCTDLGIGVLGMKPMVFGRLPESGAVTAMECLRYSMSLPVSVVITGCDSLERVEQALEAARTFKPLTEEEKADILRRTEPYAGKLEDFKTGTMFDATGHNPQYLKAGD